MASGPGQHPWLLGRSALDRRFRAERHARRRVRVGPGKGGLIAGLAGFVALAVGSVGPWVDAVFASVSGAHGDGVLTLIAAGLGALTLLFGSAGGAVFAVLMGIAGLGVSIFDIVHVSDKLSQATIDGVQVASVGWGLYVCAAGAVLAIIGALAHSSTLRRARAAANTVTA